MVERDRARVSVMVGLGSNLGRRDENLRRALALLREHENVRVLRVSEFRETDPAGGPPQGKYLNAVAEVETTLSPRDLLEVLHDIERALGRVRTVRHGPRPIDLDILLYGDRIVEDPGLEIPHPRMLEREFVLEPLAEVAPGRRHPRTGSTARGLWRALQKSARGGAGGREGSQ